MSPPRWRPLLAAVCIAQAAAIVGFDFTLPFIPLYLQNDLGIHGLGQTALWAGLIGFGPAIPATIFGPIWGRVADRFGYRAMLLRAMVSASVLLALMGLAPSPWVLLVLRMIQGSLSGTVFSAQALVAATVPERETGRAMGLLQMSVFVGATAGPVAGGVVAQALGYRATFAGAGVLLAAAAGIVFAFVKEPPRRSTSKASDAGRASLLSVVAVPAFAAALALTLGLQLASTSLFPVLPLFVQDLLHSSRGVAPATGWIMATSGMAAAGGSYLAGRLQRHVGLKPLLVVTLLLSSLLFLPQAFASGVGQLLVVRACASFAFGGLIGLVGTLAAVSSPKDAKGTAFGLVGAASSMGFGVGPLLGGVLVAVVGIRPVFVIAGALVGVLPLILAAGAGLLSVVSGARRGRAPTLTRLRSERG